MLFSPVIERSETREAFLTEDPQRMLAEGRFTRVPMMIGANDLEGDLAYMGKISSAQNQAHLVKGISTDESFPALGKPFTPEMMRETERNVCKILPAALREAVIAKNGCPEVAQLIRDAYFDGKHFDSSIMNFVYVSIATTICKIFFHFLLIFSFPASWRFIHQ